MMTNFEEQTVCIVTYSATAFVHRFVIASTHLCTRCSAVFFKLTATRIYSVSVLSRFWVSKLHPKYHNDTLNFGRDKTIWGKHVFLRVATGTDGAAAMIVRHSSLAQKLKAEIVTMVCMHCHVHRLALSCCYTADLYAVRKCESTLLQIWKCFAASPLRSACLAMHQTSMKTRKVGDCSAHVNQGGFRVRQLRVTRSTNLIIISVALKQLPEMKYDAMCIDLLRLMKTKDFIVVL